MPDDTSGAKVCEQTLKGHAPLASTVVPPNTSPSTVPWQQPSGTGAKLMERGK